MYLIMLVSDFLFPLCTQRHHSEPILPSSGGDTNNSLTTYRNSKLYYLQLFFTCLYIYIYPPCLEITLLLISTLNIYSIYIYIYLHSFSLRCNLI